MPDPTATSAAPTASARSPQTLTPELTPALLEAAERRLVAKALAELSHERLITPQPVTPSEHSTWQVQTPEGTTYTFTARRHHLEHWVIDPASLRCRDCAGLDLPLDAQRLILELRDALAIPEDLLPVYLEEIAATLAGAMWKQHHHQLTARDLLAADHQAIEAAMIEGHPSFIANNGRIGFSRDDHAAYAPEAGMPVRLLWIAVRRSTGHLSLSAGLSEAELLEQSLDPAVRQAFSTRLTDLGLEPSAYLLMPLHPWQWRHKIAITFAPEIARYDIVLLGEGPEAHQAQQSIRTFYNLDSPHRPYLKTALSIQNMGFLRGLSPRYMESTPAINDWVAQLVLDDHELQSRGFTILREIAAVGWTGDPYHRLPTSNPHQKMLAALWRESPVNQLGEHEKAMTMAALLHRDHEGTALATLLVAASGQPPTTWLRHYLDAYLRPLIHCLLAYDLAFMPHGENVILVLRDAVPVRILMKDIGEEVAVMGDLEVPDEIERIRASVPQSLRSLSILTDVFDGVLRHLAGIMVGDGLLSDDDFWSVAADVVEAHASDHPELAEAASRYDFTRAEFDHSCLNRLQLRNTVQMVDLADQTESLIFAGTLANPIARTHIGAPAAPSFL